MCALRIFSIIHILIVECLVRCTVIWQTYCRSKWTPLRTSTVQKLLESRFDLTEEDIRVRKRQKLSNGGTNGFQSPYEAPWSFPLSTNNVVDEFWLSSPCSSDTTSSLSNGGAIILTAVGDAQLVGAAEYARARFYYSNVMFTNRKCDYN